MAICRVHGGQAKVRAGSEGFEGRGDFPWRLGWYWGQAMDPVARDLGGGLWREVCRQADGAARRDPAWLAGPLRLPATLAIVLLLGEEEEGVSHRTRL
jgi:hypothetical protein